jgi:hypothetical protein
MQITSRQQFDKHLFAKKIRLNQFPFASSLFDRWMATVGDQVTSLIFIRDRRDQLPRLLRMSPF